MEEEEIIEQIKNRPRIGLARQLARKLLKEVELKEPPISLWKVIQHLKLENDLSVEPVNDFGEKISGVLVIFEDQPTIGFNKRKHWYHRRFTIAHEIGHLRMGTTCVGIGTALQMPFLTNNNPNEVAANQFAAELLMPLEQLKKDFKNGIQNIDELSDRYKISKEAAGWKILRSGVLTNSR